MLAPAALSFWKLLAAVSAVAFPFTPPSAQAAGSTSGRGDITWDFATIQHKAKGCDLWQTTWAPDGSLRTGWGDCVGPRPAPNTKLGTMYAKIVGSATSHTVSSVDTGATGRYNDYPSNGLNSIGLGHHGWKPASFLHVDGKLWTWSFGGGDNSCTRSRLKTSSNYNATTPTFRWANWTLHAVGYASFVQYGQAYAGGPSRYVYAVIPMSGPRQVSNNCLEGVSHFGLLRGSRGSLGAKSTWQYFTGLNGGIPTWVSVTAGGAALAKPIFSSPTRLKYPARGSMTYNAGKNLFFLSMPWLPRGCDKIRGRFCAGLEVWSAATPWGPDWKLRFRSDTTWPGGTTTCGSGTAPTNRGAGEEAHFPPKWMSADGRTMHLISSTADCLTVLKATIP